MAGPALNNVLRLPQHEPEALPEALDIAIHSDDPEASSFDARTGTVRIVAGDGSVEIGPPQRDESADDGDHFANLADKIGATELGRLADELLRGIEIDEQSRADWLENYSNGISLLGLMLRYPGTSSQGAQGGGISKVNHPLLKEAVIRFQAQARGELLPTDGPVKVRDDGEKTESESILAQALQDDLNHYLTTVATEYYPDTDRAFFYTGFGGCSFKKVFNCPIRRRPVSESVDAKDLIVSNAATDLKSCGRVTHRIKMPPATLKRMQLVGAYRDVTLAVGILPVPNPVDRKISEVQGIAPPTQLEPQDRDREILECYAQTEVQGFEHKEKGKLTGLPLPWKITIDKDSREILEVRRNWERDDDLGMPRTVFVKYPYIRGFGFYDIGLLQILGDCTLAVTASWRQQLDAAAFSSFPGFLYLKTLGRQLTNEFRVPPGGGAPIDAAGVNDIRQAIMPLPYQPPNPAMMQLTENIVQTAQRVGGTAEMPVGEGRQDAPVGTTLALIEQATKIEGAVFKNLHQAQGEEFRLLKECFMQDPEALWRHNKKSRVLKLLLAQGAARDPALAANAKDKEARDEAHNARFVAALADCDLVPMADPNTSSKMQRHMRTAAMMQITMNDPAFDQTEVKMRALRDLGVEDADALRAPPNPQAAPPDPKLLAAQASLMTAQVKLADMQNKARSSATDAQIEQQKLAVQERVAQLQVIREQIIHQNDTRLAQQRMMADSVNKHLDRQSDLHKHAVTQALDHGSQRQQMGLDNLHRHLDRAADLHKHFTGLEADTSQPQ